MSNAWIRWGHVMDSDRAMYDLSDADLNSRLLEYGYGTNTSSIEKGHYLQMTGETLPFDDFAFDLALSAHTLFIDSDEQTIDTYLRVLKELARVAKEVRIFPINHDSALSPFLGPVLLGLQQENYGVEVRQVNYPVASAGNAMLRIWAQECKVS